MVDIDTFLTTLYMMADGFWKASRPSTETYLQMLNRAKHLRLNSL